jgi:hypothetical protein
MKRKPSKGQSLRDYVRARLDEPGPHKAWKPVPANRKFRARKAVKPGSEFRPKPKKTDPLKLLKRIL